ncbi:Poly [Penaeus vannamei]|uniref:Poly [ADP-ribose] polymerase n=1 Tax=Penaeus vannamei TaxID=6689 RepID=A0A423SLF0_PENVA|nr:Poly [Penaeus vannamei]
MPNLSSMHTCHSTSPILMQRIHPNREGSDDVMNPILLDGTVPECKQGHRSIASFAMNLVAWFVDNHEHYPGLLNPLSHRFLLPFTLASSHNHPPSSLLHPLFSIIPPSLILPSSSVIASPPFSFHHLLISHHPSFPLRYRLPDPAPFPPPSWSRIHRLSSVFLSPPSFPFFIAFLRFLSPPTSLLPPSPPSSALHHLFIILRCSPPLFPVFTASPLPLLHRLSPPFFTASPLPLLYRLSPPPARPRQAGARGQREHAAAAGDLRGPGGRPEEGRQAQAGRLPQLHASRLSVSCPLFLSPFPFSFPLSSIHSLSFPLFPFLFSLPYVSFQCIFPFQATVHEEYACMLNQTNIGQNNNKFYVIRSQRQERLPLFHQWGRVATVHEEYACMLKPDQHRPEQQQVLRHPGRQRQRGFSLLHQMGESGRGGPVEHRLHGEGEDAIKAFEKKFKDKTRNNWADRDNFEPVAKKYTLLEMDDDSDEEEVGGDSSEPKKELVSYDGPCNLHKRTILMIKLIFSDDMFVRQMADMSLDVKKMPLGKLSKLQIAKGLEALIDIEDAIKKNKPRSVLMELTSKFYTLIPHNFGRSAPPVIDTDEVVQKKKEVMLTLSDIELTQSLQKEKIISEYATACPYSRKGPLLDVWRVDRKGEKDSNRVSRNFFSSPPILPPPPYTSPSIPLIPPPPLLYLSLPLFPFLPVPLALPRPSFYLYPLSPSSSPTPKPKNNKAKAKPARFAAHDAIQHRKLLWHGTNVAVVAAILKAGLRIMPHSGGRVGRGIYFASEHAKSSYYVGYHYGTYEGESNVGFMFLVEVALGKENNIMQDDCSLTQAPKGYESVVARGKTEPDDESDEEEDEVDSSTPKKELVSYDGPCNLHKRTMLMIKLIFSEDMFVNQMADMSLDVKKMPLGKLSKLQIAKGLEALIDIEDAIKKSKPRNVLMELTSKFFTLIPHNFGRSAPPVIDTDEVVQKKKEVMLTLSDIELTQSLQKEKENKDLHPLLEKYEMLDCLLEYVEKSSSEFKVKLLKEYATACPETRKGPLLDVWRVDRKGEKERFAAHDAIQHRKLLWHGTNVAVVAAILKAGLRIMPHSGGLVGRGIYFASEHAKSSWYVGDHYGIFEGERNVGFMFLVEVALGRESSITQCKCSLTKAPNGYDSVVARGSCEPDPKKNKKVVFDGKDVIVPVGKPVPQKEWAQSGFCQSEYLVYKESQARIRYVLKFSFEEDDE